MNYYWEKQNTKNKMRLQQLQFIELFSTFSWIKFQFAKRKKKTRKGQRENELSITILTLTLLKHLIMTYKKTIRDSGKTRT